MRDRSHVRGEEKMRKLFFNTAKLVGVLRLREHLAPKILWCSFLLAGILGCQHTMPLPAPEEECSSSPDFQQFDTLPQVVRAIQPQYPDSARQAGLEGVVLLRALINKKGEVMKVEILQSDAAIFNQPAIEAMKQWLFTPALLAGQPVCVWGAIPFRFKL